MSWLIYPGTHPSFVYIKHTYKKVPEFESDFVLDSVQVHTYTLTQEDNVSKVCHGVLRSNDKGEMSEVHGLASILVDSALILDLFGSIQRAPRIRDE